MQPGASRLRRSATLRDVEGMAAEWLSRNSIALLRISMGSIFAAFGVLKFVPGMSPAESLVVDTVSVLTFGLVPERLGLLGVAALETTIGVLLISGLWMRLALALLAVQLVGILSPLVVLSADMFRAPLAPTLAGQYVLKDVVLVAGGLVIAARALGARMVVD